MTTALARTTPASAARKRLRVMVVDDAVVVRGLFAHWIEAEPDFELVAALRNGREALDRLERADPDVVVLDIDMPELDGITALPLLLRSKPGLLVIMASTLTRRNAEISLRALALGAADYIPKPETTRDAATALPFRRELIDKIRGLGARLRRAPPAGQGAAAPRPHSDGRSAASAPATRFRLRPFSVVPPRVLLIGVSTGGPQALTSLIPRLAAVSDKAPILITQHMPPTFTTILAEHLQTASGRPVREAVDGEPIERGTVYLAPGGRHLRVERQNGRPVAILDDGPPVNYCRPAVDPMFSSGAVLWGAATLGLVLTGMGSDGMRGAEAIAAVGGSVIAQDEASSVIWGMPAQALAAGACAAVLPLEAMAATITRLFAGERP